MSSDSPDSILAAAGDMLTKALDGLRFRAGDPGTKVISGFPFTVVGAPPSDKQPSSRVEVLSNYTLPWYSEGVSGGSAVFFNPVDPTIGVGGNGCYDTPRPYLTIPAGADQFLYLKQTFELDAWAVCDSSVAYGPSTQDITLTSSEFVALDDIPESTFPDPGSDACGDPIATPNGYWQWPGTYVLYFLVALVRGVDGDPVIDLAVHTNATLMSEDNTKNYGARAILTDPADAPGLPTAAEGYGVSFVDAGGLSGIAAGMAYSEAP